MMLLNKTLFLPLACLLPLAGPVVAQTAGPEDPASYSRPVHCDRPIDPDRYMIRPGEVLLVTFVKASLPPISLTVNTEGKIVDQNLGQISVVDLTLADARRVLREALSHSYHAGDVVISAGEPYLVSIQVSGAVNAPGRYRAYTCQRVSEIIDSAGGIAPRGSTRLIRFSGPSREYNVDLDRAIYLADVAADPCLYSGLSVFVPPRSLETVQVVGAVCLPRQIEFAGDDGLNQLIGLAGGACRQADVASAYIVNDSGRNPAEPGAIAPGDVVMVPYAGSAAETEQLRLFGAVRKIGRFRYQVDMTLEQLLDKAGGLTAEANAARITVFRRAESDIWGNQAEGRYAILGESGSPGRVPVVRLSPSDSVFIPRMLGYVKISGDVRRPGLYSYEAGTDASHYIAKAGGYAGGHGSTSVSLFDRISGVTTDISPGAFVQDGDEIRISYSGATE